uniref:Uncharacterized protein n=1 Tax=Wuchereria bancrofti TaxID=6293 RepID=A0AAF5Q5Z4_WUCBA
MFFALEECKNLLISCNDEMDFVEQKLLKQIVLDHAACTLGKNSEAQFIIHAKNGLIRCNSIEMITSVRQKMCNHSESDCDENNGAKENRTKQVT